MGFWEDVKKDFSSDEEFMRWLKSRRLKQSLLYSASAHFPDFVMRSRRIQSRLACGSLLELKDSKSGTIASFNSTLPTRFKTLEEVDAVNGDNLVSNIASIKDGPLAGHQDYRLYERRCFYLVRTHVERLRECDARLQEEGGRNGFQVWLNGEPYAAQPIPLVL